MINQAVNVVWGQLDLPQQPKLWHWVVPERPQTGPKASVAHIQSHCARNLGEYGFTGTHKTVKHHPKVILSVT